jgi:hypothetical protein
MFSFHIFIKAKFGCNSLWMPTTVPQLDQGMVNLCAYIILLKEE